MLDDVLSDCCTRKSVNSKSNWKAKREVGLVVPAKYKAKTNCKLIATTLPGKLLERQDNLKKLRKSNDMRVMTCCFVEFFTAFCKF